MQSQRYRLRYDGMIHILEIPKVRDYDSGNLRIVAKNPVGAVECTSSMLVVPRDDWRSRLKQAPRCESFDVINRPSPVTHRPRIGAERSRDLSVSKKRY